MKRIVALVLCLLLLAAACAEALPELPEKKLAAEITGTGSRTNGTDRPVRSTTGSSYRCI